MNRLSSFFTRSAATSKFSRSIATASFPARTQSKSISAQLKTLAAISGSHKLSLLLASAAIGISTYSFDRQSNVFCEIPSANVNWTKLYDAIADTLEDENYDDGSYGPIYVRLAWHSSGTYDKNKNNGGSIGGTIRFKPESDHGGNAGLEVARKRLETVKAKFPGVTYADLYTFAGVVAIQEMAGPDIYWRPGRRDAKDGGECTPDGRLPDGAQGASHVRDVFGRMGFTEREMVALIGGGHSIGRCHTDRSGFDGPWTYSPTTFSNNYFTLLLGEDWVDREQLDGRWTGPMQYGNSTGQRNALMMLPSDMAFKTDPEFAKWSKFYAENPEQLNRDFAAAFAKLLELGVKFPSGVEPKVYKGSN